MKIKPIIGIAALAVCIFAINGWTNLQLMKPLPDVGEAVNEIRFYLDDAVFVLLFFLVGLLFLCVYAVLPKERGYLYLACFALLASLQLFSQWDGKEPLLGVSFQFPYYSIATRSGLSFIGFVLIGYVLQTNRKKLYRSLHYVNLALFGITALLSIVGASEPFLAPFHRLTLAVILLNIVVYAVQIASIMKHRTVSKEMRDFGFGFALFMVVLSPDLLKDVFEDLLGTPIGYRPIYWEQSLEDTFPWALLVLVMQFGFLFFQRFNDTRKDNVEEIRARKSLDQFVGTLSKNYRASDLEHAIEREGALYFEGCTLKVFKWKLGEDQATPETKLCWVGRFGEMDTYLGLVKGSGDGEISDRDANMLELMAKYVSMLMENVQFVSRKLDDLEVERNRQPWAAKLFMQLAEKERKRLASDLHDEVLQEILHIRRMVEHVPSMEHVRVALDNVEFMIRETCRELMPSFLAEHGVLKAIAALADKTRLRADFRLETKLLPISAPIDEERALALYRIVQELISNAQKHAEASSVLLEVGQWEEMLTVRYEDDGVGMVYKGDASEGAGFGLRGITERVRMLGGTIDFRSAPGEGTAVLCSIPAAVKHPA